MDMDTTIAHWAARRAVPLPATFIAARLERERRKSERLAANAVHPVRRRRSPHWLVPTALALGRMAGPARRVALRVGLVHHTLPLAGLPSAFEGFRVLQVSDPHFGADPELDAAIIASVQGVAHDLCVLTGDYRYRSFGSNEIARRRTLQLHDALDGNAETLVVLGNHDSLALAPPFEAAGMRVLLNECANVRRDDAVLHVAGVDDPRYYRLDDLDRALSGRDPAAESATLLLAHSPEIAEKAAAAGCSGYLCGHTHGGQVCLPGGGIVMRNARAPLGRLSGAWQLGDMSGYTSRGAGVSIAVARLNCPAEITLHTLTRHAVSS